MNFLDAQGTPIHYSHYLKRWMRAERKLHSERLWQRVRKRRKYHLNSIVWLVLVSGSDDRLGCSRCKKFQKLTATFPLLQITQNKTSLRFTIYFKKSVLI